MCKRADLAEDELLLLKKAGNGSSAKVRSRRWENRRTDVVCAGCSWSAVVALPALEGGGIMYWLRWQAIKDGAAWQLMWSVL